MSRKPNRRKGQQEGKNQRGRAVIEGGVRVWKRGFISLRFQLVKTSISPTFGIRVEETGEHKSRDR